MDGLLAADLAPGLVILDTRDLEESVAEVPVEGRSVPKMCTSFVFVLFYSRQSEKSAVGTRSTPSDELICNTNGR
jgi:hypothetical protein